MTTYIKYRNFQCPKCTWNEKELHWCSYGQEYIFKGTKFKGIGTRPCPHYKEKPVLREE